MKKKESVKAVRKKTTTKTTKTKIRIKPEETIITVKKTVRSSETISPAKPRRCPTPKGSNSTFFNYNEKEKETGLTPSDAVIPLSKHQIGSKHLFSESPGKTLSKEGEFYTKDTLRGKINALILELTILKRRVDVDFLYHNSLDQNHLRTSYLKVENCIKMCLEMHRICNGDLNFILKINKAITSDWAEDALYNPLALRAVYLKNHSPEAVTYAYDFAAVSDSEKLQAPLTEQLLLNAPRPDLFELKKIGVPLCGVPLRLNTHIHFKDDDAISVRVSSSNLFGTDSTAPSPENSEESEKKPLNSLSFN
ncbi:MAG: hypothetical protein P1U61_04840 [Legionellaceae bacterium]|nr:hypothetical protein [Legionellaceae bacterium]